jgi:hypothetical protein
LLLLFQKKKLENSEPQLFERNLLSTKIVDQNLYSKQPLKQVADSVPTHPGSSTIDVLHCTKADKAKIPAFTGFPAFKKKIQKNIASF